MQRCPYIHEMRERLLGPQNQTAINMESMMERDGLIDNRQSDNQVGTVVKLNADGYGSHTSPAHQRTPLVPRDLGEDFSLDNDDEPYDPRKPKNAKTSLFIITSLVYAMLLIVVCIAYVISDVSTHQLPVLYYEGFFTYLYGASILFLLYVFCFLLQESTCCSGGKPKPPKEKKPKKQKPKKPDPVDGKDLKSGTKDAAGVVKDTKDSGKGEKNKPSPFQDTAVNVEVTEPVATPKAMRKRKTTQNDQVHGSFFLRVGAIAFGLGTMIYVGLEFGTFFEIPFTSQCHQILRGVNPLLQMIFTFMQMYFIFMNSRLNIHRFKVLARFGLMHICATNICVWIRTLVLESLKEITVYHQGRAPLREDNAILETIRQHSLRHAGTVMGTHKGPDTDWEMVNTSDKHPAPGSNLLSRIVQSTVRALTDATEATTMGYDNYMRRFSTTTSTMRPTTSTTTSTTTHSPSTTPSYNSYFNNVFQYRNHDATIHDDDSSSPMRKMFKKIITSSTSTSTTSTSTSTTTTPQTTSLFDIITDDYISTTSTPSTAGTTADSRSSWSSTNPLSAFFATLTTPSTTTSTTSESSVLNLYENFEPVFQKISHLSLDISNPEYHQESYENFDNIYPAALIASDITSNSTSCGRVNIMGTIVQDSAPYLYPFIIEYSLIGAVVIYVMWKHIGRYPKYTEEDLEHRLEIMLSRRAVAMAQAHSGRVDCVGASKGLFFGLLLLVGSLICLILFFVLVRHPHFSLLAIYLADVSHCAIMGFAVFAIFVGFIRVQTLKFRCEDQSNLNDILLRISAFGLFIYSVFSVIAGSLNAMVSEPNLLVMITGILAVAQVVFQLLFIADVSRRRVHLPEHDRSKPARQIVTFLLICNIAMFAIYTFEAQKVFANPVQLDFYGFIAWSLIQRVTLPLCIFHRFHSAVTLAEIWKTTYKARLE